jgi:hypothetical protein
MYDDSRRSIREECKRAWGKIALKDWAERVPRKRSRAILVEYAYETLDPRQSSASSHPGEV